KYFREHIVGNSEGYIDASEIGLTSRLAKAFHQYFNHNDNDNIDFINFLVIAAISGEDNYLFKFRNSFTGKGMTFYLDKIINNDDFVNSPLGEPYSALSFIMLLCPLIFFTV